jgi:uncharacterized protein
MIRITEWFIKAAPTRESLSKNRFLSPFAQRILHPALWRLTRRSVPRGVALGLLVANFLPFPGFHTGLVALLALPVRANIPIGVAITFLMTPTIPFVLASSIYIGNSVLRLNADSRAFNALINDHAPVSMWLSWLLSEAAPAILAGLFIISVVSASIGYVVSALFWRWWIKRKWRRRSKAIATGR